jgi:hypothetical protein
MSPRSVRSFASLARTAIMIAGCLACGAPDDAARPDGGPIRRDDGGAGAGDADAIARDDARPPPSDTGRAEPPSDLPEWVPAPGEIADISLNTMSDLNPCPPHESCMWSDVEHQQGMFAWVGTAYTSGVGRFGRLSHWGGGHNAYSGNEVYVFDFDTRLWDRKKEPYPANADTPYNEWGELDGVLGEPIPPHTYRQWFGLAPEWGGAPGGSAVQLSYAAIGRAAHGSAGSHIYDHESGTWSRYATTLCPVHLSYNPIAFDTMRGKFYGIYAANGELGTGVATLDTATRTWSIRGDIGVGPRNGFSTAGYTVMDYVPTLDVLVAIEAMSEATATSPVIWTLDVADLVSGRAVAWTRRESSAYELPALATGHSLSWSPLLGRFGIYWVDLAGTVIYLTPPETIDGRWEWSSETFGGAAALPADADLVRSTYNRFNWVQALRSFSWYTRVNGPVQLWRPAGT